MDAKRLLAVFINLILLFVVATCAAVDSRKPGERATPAPELSRLFVAPSASCEARSPCYGSIQDAVDAAPEGAVIEVGQGVYTTTESQVVAIKKAVRLVGGYRVEDWSISAAGAERTTVDAEGVPGRRGIYIDGTNVPTITLVGFQIRGGHAQESDGGGIYVAGGSVVMENNSVVSSTAEMSGGGVFVLDGQVTMRRNVIRGNSARYGGGLYVEGGNVSLEGDAFIGNEAGPVGGAIALGGGALDGANVTVVQNALAEAGIYLRGGHLAASHWTLADNGRYGVIADLGVEIDTGSARIRNTIIASHSAGLCGAGAAAHQTLFHEVNTPCMAGASCVGNLFGDPRFVNALDADYHIQRDSAAVDQGHNVDVWIDMEGEPRPSGSAPDIGADELAPQETVYLPLVIRQSSSGRP